VKENKGSAGVDGADFEKYEANLKDNLYKLWNRMSSGSYFPKAVKAVEIPKKNGGTRRLGIPTIDDTIAQMTAKLLVEPILDPLFHEDSYGYRPNKSAIDAVGMARQRCWKYDYVIDLDLKGMFDNIDHELLMRAVRKHVKERWIQLYIERWLKAPFQTETREIIPRTAGTPQGGESSAQYWQICLCTMFLTCGWQETIEIIRLKDMRMIRWCTAGQNRKRSNFWQTLMQG